MAFDEKTGAIGFDPNPNIRHSPNCCAVRGCHAVCSHGCGRCLCWCHPENRMPGETEDVGLKYHDLTKSCCAVRGGTQAECVEQRYARGDWS